MANVIINELKDIIESCNINFLFGSGMSAPYFSTLGNIEQLLTKLQEKIDSEEVSNGQASIVRASLYKKYFDEVIFNNISILDMQCLPPEKCNYDVCCVFNNYRIFLKAINSILLNRRSTILSKQINIFTTNIDIFFEKALERANVEYNDGFGGRFNPLFDLSNFKKSYFKKSLHYDNTYELPVFNLMKMHGSLTWSREYNKGEKNEDILFSSNLELIQNIKDKEVPKEKLIEVVNDMTIEDLISKIGTKTTDDSINQFMKEYEKLSIVNPTKEKFKDTVLNQTHYELLRIFSNELEKENTVLFVMGFSFADEHIRKLTVRAANSNPTLQIFIFAYMDSSKLAIEAELVKSRPNNKNIKVISPQDLRNKEDPDDKKDIKFNFQTINEVIFDELFQMIDKKLDKKKDNE